MGKVKLQVVTPVTDEALTGQPAFPISVIGGASAPKEPVSGQSTQPLVSKSTSPKPATVKGTTAAKRVRSSSASPKKRSAPAGRGQVVLADLATKHVVCCRAHESLNVAGQLMWENDVGIVVVVDEEHRPVSVLTDRDMAMAAYTQGAPLTHISVGSCMAQSVVTCEQTEPAKKALELMQLHRLRRLPVVDGEGKLAGLVGLADLVRALAVKMPKTGLKGGDVVATVTAILK